VLITALFYYFGWVYAHSFLGYFGVDPSLVGYSTADYVLRTANVVFYPFLDAAFGALVIFGFHRLAIIPVLTNVKSDLSEPLIPYQSRLGPAVDSAVSGVQAWCRQRPGPVGIRRFLTILRVVAIIFAATVLTGATFPEQIGAPLGLLLPLLLIASVILLGYAAHLNSRYPVLLAKTMRSLPIESPRGYTLTLLILGLLAALWTVSLYGDNVGTRRATDMTTQLFAQSGVTIYSTERIALKGPGVDVQPIEPPGKYRYQYTGLRLLAHSSDKFLLLPLGWQHGHDRAFLVRDDNSIRVDIAAW
jgi:hypothetical protein